MAPYNEEKLGAHQEGAALGASVAPSRGDGPCPEPESQLMLSWLRDNVVGANAVIRTPNGNDYGKDLLRQHLQQHPH